MHTQWKSIEMFYKAVLFQVFFFYYYYYYFRTWLHFAPLRTLTGHIIRYTLIVPDEVDCVVFPEMTLIILS